MKMGIEKAEVKIGVAQELGRKYADMLKELDNEVLKIEGEKRAYKKAQGALSSIFKRVDQDLDSGRFEGLGPLEIAKAVKIAIQQVSQALESLGTGCDASKLTTMGQAQGLLKASEVVQKVALSEQGKIDALAAALEKGETGVPVDVVPVPHAPRPIGMRPGESIAAKRKAAALEEQPIPQKSIRTSKTTRVLKAGGGPKKD